MKPNLLKRKLLLSILFSILYAYLSVHPWSAYAQSTITISGRILDGQNQALPGASVFLKGTTLGSLSAPDGAFLIKNVPPGEYMLSASFAGYKKTEQKISNSNQDVKNIQLKLFEDVLQMNEVVVTGSNTALTKFESSITITTLNTRELQERVPRSTGDLLKTVPGFSVNNTRGEIGNGLVVRGLPPGGPGINSFIFVGLHEDGLPVYEIPNGPVALDYHFRADETVGRMETVRGGSSTIFASNSGGGLINFISKTGGKEFEGLAKLTVGNQPSYRFDINFGGPLTDKLRYNIGGFYRYDLGIRNFGGPANVGGQIKANFTYDINKGYVRLYTRFLDDRNKLFTNIPYQNFNKPEEIPGGQDLSTGVTYGQELNNIFRQPDPYNIGSNNSYEARDGVHVQYRNLQLDVHKELGNGFTITNKSKIIGAIITQRNLNLEQSPSKFTTSDNQMYTFVNSGDLIDDIASINGNGLQYRQNLTSSDHRYWNFINYTLLSKQVGERLNVQFGPYVSQVNQFDRTFQSNLLTDSKGNLINWTTVDTTGTPTAIHTQNGFVQYSTPGNQSFISNAKQSYTIAALFAGADWKITDKLRAEGGIRYEYTNAIGSTERPTTVNLDKSAVTRYDNNFATGSGRFRTWDYDYQTYNFSLGFNYLFSDRIAAYVRGSRGNRTPTPHNHFNLVEKGTPEGNGVTLKSPPDRMYHVEGALKVNLDRFHLIPTVFYSTIKIRQNIVNSILQPGNYLDNVVDFINTSTVGLELEAGYQLTDDVTLRFNGTVQDARYGDMKIPMRALVPAEAPPVGVPTTIYEIDVTGNKMQQTPDFIADLGASYRIFKNFSLYANYRYTDGYYLNRRNSVKVDGWGELAGGISFEKNNLLLTIRGNNLLNTVALQNGTGTSFENIASINESGEAVYDFDPNTNNQRPNSFYGLGQFILPRTVFASLTIKF